MQKSLLTTPVFILFFVCAHFSAQAQQNDLVFKHLVQGSNYFNRGNLAGAIGEFTSAIKYRPTFGDSYFNRGYCKFKLKDYVGAIEDFNLTIDWSPNDAQTFFLRAESHRELKHYLDAERDYTKALDYGYPKSEQIYVKRAQVSTQLKHYERAEKDMMQVLRTAPTLYNMYYKLGLISYQANKNNEAANYFSKFLQYQPNNISVRQIRASIYFDNKQYDKAVPDLDVVIRAEPDNSSAYFQRGSSYSALNDADKACDDLHSAFQLGYLPAKKAMKKHCKK
jgi:tetratricopeptide (TPR) repeat protein